ncbi:MAG: AarF/ABC1/UbiB kinase family protein, partial [Chloroflexi bacterium]|nr:AarF/ABC1/UbiB kinase family protein [Chloroflexota bacterium]
MRFPFRITVTEIRRARQIAEVLIRNGLGFLAETTGLTRFLPPWRARRLRTDVRAVGLTIPQRFRQTLEELGPTFIKLGQVLSTRPDVLPAEYILELSKLLDAAPPVPPEEIVRVLEEELHGPLSQFFSSLDPQPIASASIGQVHRATLNDGTPVVVKVQRPSIERIVQADLNLLYTQAAFLERRSETLRSYGLLDIIEEFSQALRDELDYTQEGRNADRVRQVAEGEGILVPKVYWDLTTRRVITLSDLRGIKLSEIEALREAGYDLAALAAQVVQCYMRLVFVHGIFHADPHPANILVCDAQIGLVDFGVIGYLTGRIQEDLGDLLFALAEQNAEEMVRIIVRMGATNVATDRTALERDVRRLLVRYYNVSLESLPMAQFLGELMALAFRHHVRLPSDLALLARTVVVLEGVARTLDPSLVLARYLEPFVAQLVRRRLSLKRTVMDSISTLRELEDLLRVLPRRMDTISEQVERGEMTLGVEVRRLNQALARIEAIGNRISFSVVVAALIVGSALLLVGGGGAAIFRIPFTEIVLP